MSDPRPAAARGAPDIETLKSQVQRPARVVVTAGMPYANGPLHLGHLAGVHIPADIYARYMRMLIGSENVLFVCGTDDHGSTSELSALTAGKPVRQFIDEIHAKQTETLKNFGISLDVYTGTSRPECFPIHSALCQDFLRKLHKNGLLEKKASLQWFDPKLGRFLQDRFVRGKCPNPKCENKGAFSDECDECGAKYDATELLEPKSALSDATPELKSTTHWWLDMWAVSETLREWIQGKKNTWRGPVYNEVVNTVMPSLQFENTHEEKYKSLKASLPTHKSKYAAGKKIQAQFENKTDMAKAEEQFSAAGIPVTPLDAWAHRSISRDVAWGIPMPADLDADMKGKTLYVWPDSLIAPISFTQVALKNAGRDSTAWKDFWQKPGTQISQFIGQDNVYFYILMQGAMWVGTQSDPARLPQAGDYQLTDVFSVFHLMVNGEKMSKSKGNFFTGDQLLGEMGYAADQVRYFASLLTLPEKASNFDFETLKERNKFLAGPLNAAFEKPISACHSKFGGTVPDGKLMEKAVAETTQVVRRFFKSMEKAEYSTLLYAIENYARQINSLFTQFKPHDDRHDETERKDALFTCFYVLKNLLIMLSPFAPFTMTKLRQSLNLPESVLTIAELGKPIPAGHKIGEKQVYFPAVAE